MAEPFVDVKGEGKPRDLVPVMVRLVGPIDWNADIIGLSLSHGRHLHAKFAEVKSRHLFVERFRKNMHAELVLVRILPKSELSEHLVCERRTHDERRMTSCTTKINKSTFGQNQDGMTVRKRITVDGPAFVHI